MTLHAGENQLAGASQQTIFNLTLTTADFEYSQALPTNTRKIGIKPRSSTASIKLSFVEGESGTKYTTIPPSGWWHDLIGMPNATVYLQSTTAGTVAEIEAWS